MLRKDGYVKVCILQINCDEKVCDLTHDNSNGQHFEPVSPQSRGVHSPPEGQGINSITRAQSPRPDRNLMLKGAYTGDMSGKSSISPVLMETTPIPQSWIKSTLGSHSGRKKTLSGLPDPCVSVI